MPDRGLSRLIKSRKKRLSLLRRLSTPSEPESEKAGVGADPANLARKSSSHLASSVPPPPHLDADLRKSYPLTNSSSLPPDHLSSTEDVPGRVAAGAAGSTPTSAKSESSTHQRNRRGLRTADNPDEEGPQPREEQECGLRQKTPKLQRDRPKNLSTASSTPDRYPSRPSSPINDTTFPPFAATAAAAASSASGPHPDSRQFDNFSQPTTSTRGRERVVSPAAGRPLHHPSCETVKEGVLDTGHRAVTSNNNTDRSDNSPTAVPVRPTIAARRQSLLPPSQQHLVNRLLEPGLFSPDSDLLIHPFNTVPLEMVPRKIWVKRPHSSATLVSIAEDSLVDELRDHVLRKYSNSLGRSFDSPDLVIRISPRESSNRPLPPDRILSPEEALSPLIDTYYPGGQTIEEALIIDAPARKTPKPSPRQSYYYHAEPGEHGEYFPLMPVPVTVGTPPAHGPSPMSTTSGVSAHQTPSMSILTTGKVPPLPSPGSRPSRHPQRRPPFARHTTNSPTLVASSSAAKDASIAMNGQVAASAPSLPTPPAPAAPPDSPTNIALSPTIRVPSPRPGRKTKKGGVTSPSGGAFSGLIEGTVPPINVLIVEDNVINQKLLEAFMKRLSVRWQCAPNGEVAVKKWRQGGFHLVLMDIQLPVMNGLEATKEIRRLERLNGIGVFSKTASGRSSAASTAAESVDGRSDVGGSLKQEDILGDLSLFKSPVIIVALTASSLQSDRHEALAAGCNDFLTKPVGFPWLEQKVTEWGCMQALIDFEGWRKWRGYEDTPRTITPVRSEPGSPTSPRNTAIRLTSRAVASVKDSSKVTVASPASSGSGSSKSEDIDVTSVSIPQEAAANGR